MLDTIMSGGILMLFIGACSIVSLTIIVEKALSLRKSVVMPDNIVKAIKVAQRNNGINAKFINGIRKTSPLGEILGVALKNSSHGRDVVKESTEEAGRQVIHKMEKFLNTLGTVSSITPLLGLLGTVIGMIEVFTAIITAGVGDPTVLAGGISKALVTTAAGLIVAIPSMMAYRFYRGRIDELVIAMESEAVELMEEMYLSSEKTFVENTEAPRKKRVVRKKTVARPATAETKKSVQGESNEA